ncbi:MAG TPA: carboxypeptidase-like regulatory domain-containing protein [Bryobacteraceae bacterium]|nr:carboxypeptidase-like regulatory domain-containing protein [Bryobacteraceae bacterium]
MMRILLCAALFVGSLPAQVASGEPEDDGSLEGAVINAVTKEPVRKAQVTMVPGNVPPAVTDANGHFAFRKLPPGTYSLHAQHPEFPVVVSGLAGTSPLTVTLAPHEKKSDLVMTLTPGASISGRVMNEDEKPVGGCAVQAMQFAPGPPANRLYGTRAASSDDRGEYRIYGLARGRYYVSVECNQPLPQAHGLVRRSSDVDLPTQRYAAQFYPDSPDPSGASRLMVPAGASVTGIDFHMHVTSTVTVRGRINGDADAMSLKPRVELVSRDPLLSGLARYSASLNAQTGEFRISNVPAGAYVLVALAQDKRRTYEASVPVDIGTDPPQPIDLPLIPGGQFTGVIELEGDPPKPAMENVHIRLIPLDAEFSGSWPEAKVGPDGTFSLSGVVAGRWCLKAESVHGYVKSLSVGGQEMRSCVFSVTPGAGGAIRVVVSTKLAQLDGTVNGITPGQGGGVLLILVSDDAETPQTRTILAQADGRFRMSGIEPGRYHLYAASVSEGVALGQNPRAVQALEGRAARVELEAGGHATAQLDLISGEDVRQALQEAE